MPLKKYAKITPEISPTNTPNVFARFVKIPTAKIPASGTPKDLLLIRRDPISYLNLLRLNT